MHGACDCQREMQCECHRPRRMTTDSMWGASTEKHALSPSIVNQLDKMVSDNGSPDSDPRSSSRLSHCEALDRPSSDFGDLS